MPARTEISPILQGQLNSAQPFAPEVSSFRHITSQDIVGVISSGAEVGKVIRVHGPVHRGHGSKVFRGTGNIYPQDVAIKFYFDYRTGAPDRKAARAEFEALTQLSKLSEAGVTLAAFPFAVFEEIGIVVSEWLDGPTLASLLRLSGRRRARQAVSAAGGWLGRFHRATLEPAQPLHARARLSTVELDSLAGLPSLQIRSALNLLEATATQAASETAPRARLHGDFKSENLIVAKGELAGIDFGPVYRGSVINDIAQFLNNMDLSLFLFQFDLRELTREFISGYERTSGISLSRRLIAWERLVNALRLAVSHRRWCRPPRRWIIGWQLYHMISRLIAELEQRNSERADARTC